MELLSYIAISDNKLINACIELLVVGIVLWLIFWVMSELGTPAPFVKIARIILTVLAVLIAVSLLLDLK